MMDLELQLPGSVLLEIYRSVALQPGSPAGAMAFAAGFTRVKTWFTTIWDTIRDAMADVYQSGEGRISEWVDRIRDKVEEAKRELGDQADQLVAMLQENLLKSARAAHSALLRLLPMSLTVDSGDASLRELTVQYQLAVGADITISVAAALRMSAGTTVSVAAKYALP